MAKFTVKKGQDKFEVEFLENGSVKVTTDKISGANHMSVEQFLRSMAVEWGGKVERKAKGDHVHSHGGHTHEH